MQVPHVFVVPPEEDDTPTWCCFDAHNPSHTQAREMYEHPHAVVFDILCEPEDPFHRDPDAIFPELPLPRRRSLESMSVVDSFMRDDVHGDYPSDTESEYENDDSTPDDDLTQTGNIRRESRRTLRDAANDSDVVEVVKVSRKKCPTQEGVVDSQVSQQPTGIKRSATLKNRASRVFKSIRGTLRSKSRASDIAAAPPVPPLPQMESQPHYNPASTSTLTRRGSRILSQLFTGPSLKSRTSMASMETEKTPTSPTVASSHLTHDALPKSIISPPPSLHQAHTHDTEHIEERLRATSPTPTTSSSRSTNRFSKLGIHRMFSFSSRSSPPVAPPRTRVVLDEVLPTNPTITQADHSTPPIPTPIVHDDRSTYSPAVRDESSTPSSVVSSVSTMTTSGLQTPTSSEEATPDLLVGRREPVAFSAFDSFDTETFNLNSGLNFGLGLGLNLDPTPIVEVQQKNPRPSFSSLSSMSSWVSLTGKRSSESGQPRRSQTLSMEEEADTSLEMKLDSLHFDEMSFDADQFILATAR